MLTFINLYVLARDDMNTFLRKLCRTDMEASVWKHFVNALVNALTFYEISNNILALKYVFKRIYIRTI